MATEPTTYPNPRNDNAWDNDSVHWLLEHADVSAEFSRGALMECLRRQPARLRNEPRRVDRAAELAARHGVELRKVYDRDLGKEVTRIVRSDPSAPSYHW